MIRDAHKIAGEIQQLLADGVVLEQVVVTDEVRGNRHGVVLHEEDWPSVHLSRVLTVDHLGFDPAHPQNAGFVTDVEYIPTSQLTPAPHRSEPIDRALGEMKANSSHLANSPQVVCLGRGNLGLALVAWVFGVDRGLPLPPLTDPMFGPKGLPTILMGTSQHGTRPAAGPALAQRGIDTAADTAATRALQSL